MTVAARRGTVAARRGTVAAPRGRHSGSLSVAAASLLVAAFHAPLEGQLPPDIRHVTYTGLGYSGSLPDVLTGLGAFHLMPERGFGVFANGHFTLGSPAGGADFEGDRLPSDARAEGDLLQQEDEAYWSVSAGLMWPFDPEMAAYAGLGYTRERVFEQFFDPLEARGDFGYYWVEDRDRTTGGVNVTAGIFLQAGRSLFFRVGGELFPLGGSLGVYWAVPR